MAFTYDPTLAAHRDRVRFRVGDIASPGFFPDETYDTIIVDNTTDGVVDVPATVRDMAAGLAAYYSNKPNRVAFSGDLNVSWDERIKQWNLIALGKAGGATVVGTLTGGTLLLDISQTGDAP